MTYSVIVPRGTHARLMDEIRRGIEDGLHIQAQVIENAYNGPSEPRVMVADGQDQDSRAVASMLHAVGAMLGVPEGYSVREMDDCDGIYEYVLYLDQGRFYVSDSSYDSWADANLAAWRDAQIAHEQRQSDSYRMACEDIFQLMDGRSWGADTLDAIGAVLSNLGYRLSEPVE